MKDLILKSTIPIIVFFLLLLAYTKLFGPIPFEVNQISTQKNDLFTVTGEGKVEAKPDQAMVRVGVIAEGSTAKDVQDKLNVSINKVSQAIKNLGIKDEDI